MIMFLFGHLNVILGSRKWITFFNRLVKIIGRVRALGYALQERFCIGGQRASLIMPVHYVSVYSVDRHHLEVKQFTF